MTEDKCPRCGAAWRDPQPHLSYYPCQSARDGEPSALCESRQVQDAMIAMLTERDQWKASAEKAEAELDRAHALIAELQKNAAEWLRNREVKP